MLKRILKIVVTSALVSSFALFPIFQMSVTQVKAEETSFPEDPIEPDEYTVIPVNKTSFILPFMDSRNLTARCMVRITGTFRRGTNYASNPNFSFRYSAIPIHGEYNTDIDATATVTKFTYNYNITGSTIYVTMHATIKLVYNGVTTYVSGSQTEAFS